MTSSITDDGQVSDALLTSGDLVTIRPVEPSDRDGLQELYTGCSQQSLRYRFFSYSTTEWEQDVTRVLGPPAHDRAAIVALAHGTIIGLGCFETGTDGQPPEIAIVVNEQRHATGIGTLLIEHLMAIARRRGLAHLQAAVLADNHAMLRVFRDLGAATTIGHEAGVVEIQIDTSWTAAAEAAAHARESRAEYASIQRLIHPAAIAVVGASSTSHNPGRVILENILAAGYDGDLVVVSPHSDRWGEVPVVGRLIETAVTPDLVVIAVPADQVIDVARDAAMVGAHGLLVVSDGFAESGELGRDRQRDLLEVARRSGMRVIGPNCLGIVNTDPSAPCAATFAEVHVSAGKVGLGVQSGGVGLALLGALSAVGSGISNFFSIGNKADVSGNDLLMFWQHDPRTSACVLYLESFGNARKFASIANALGRTKPIVMMAAGLSEAGARGVRSHTAAAATTDVALLALCRATGLIRARTLGQLVAITSLISAGVMPAGPRVAILSNSGGPAALAADACVSAGLQVPELTRRTRDQLQQLLRVGSAVANPVDATAAVSADDIAAAAGIVADDPLIDVVMVVHAALDPLASQRLQTALASRTRSAPTVLVNLGGSVPQDRCIPVFAMPEDAAIALSALSTYSQWRRHSDRHSDEPPAFDRRQARALVTKWLDDVPKSGWLDADRVWELLRCYRLPVIGTRFVSSAAAAVRALHELGAPAVAKSGCGALVHRSDVGAVSLGIGSAASMRSAFEQIRAAQGSMAPVMIQQTAPDGVELAVGIVSDPTVGPLIMVAAGGVATDLLADRSFRLAPVTTAQATEQLGELRAAQLLHGYRGNPPLDDRAVIESIVAVGQMAVDIPEIAELDINPIIAGETTAMIVDAKIRLAPVRSTDPQLRRLSPRD